MLTGDIVRIDEQLAKAEALRSSVAALTGEAAVADELARLITLENGKPLVRYGDIAKDLGR